MDIFMRKNSFINNTARACDKPIFKKKVLLTENLSSYSFPAVAKSTAGRCNPDNTKATLDANSVFFTVVISVRLHSAVQIRTESMVALVGQLSGWPVSFVSGIATPISVTTPSSVATPVVTCFATQRRLPLWLLPLITSVRNLYTFSWPFAALTFAPYLAASKSQHLLNGMPGVFWPKTLCWPLLAACLVQRRRRAHEQ